MKWRDNKYIKAGLFITVISLWIGVVFNINLKPDDSQKLAIEIPVKNRNSISQKLDTLPIYVNYPDPFLNENSTNIEESGVEMEEEPILLKEEISWPRIRYFGMVNSKIASVNCVILEINDEKIILKQGQNFESVLVKKIYYDSIQVLFKSELRTILR